MFPSTFYLSGNHLQYPTTHNQMPQWRQRSQSSPGGANLDEHGCLQAGLHQVLPHPQLFPPIPRGALRKYRHPLPRPRGDDPAARLRFPVYRTIRPQCSFCKAVHLRIAARKLVSLCLSPASGQNDSGPDGNRPAIVNDANCRVALKGQVARSEERKCSSDTGTMERSTGVVGSIEKKRGAA